jgi:hypothetical protein
MLKTIFVFLSFSTLFLIGCTTTNVEPPMITLDSDFDDDLVDDGIDNCPVTDNPLQENWDGDLWGDVCDDDDDNDGFLDPVDNCQMLANDQMDADIDFIGDACDPLDNRPCPEHVSAMECAGGWALCELQPLETVERSTVIKASGPALYWYATDGRRYVFPNEATFRTWFPTSGDCPVVRQVPDADLATILIGGNVTYRPGARMVKIATDPRMYVVSRGGTLHGLDSEALAEDLYGPAWRMYVDDVPDSFFVNYMIGTQVYDPSEYQPLAAYLETPTIDHDLWLR